MKRIANNKSTRLYHTVSQSWGQHVKTDKWRGCVFNYAVCTTQSKRIYHMDSTLREKLTSCNISKHTHKELNDTSLEPIAILE